MSLFQISHCIFYTELKTFLLNNMLDVLSNKIYKMNKSKQKPTKIQWVLVCNIYIYRKNWKFKILCLEHLTEFFFKSTYITFQQEKDGVAACTIPHKKIKKISEILPWISCQLVLYQYCLLVLCYLYITVLLPWIFITRKTEYHWISLNLIKTSFLKLVWFSVN